MSHRYVDSDVEAAIHSRDQLVLAALDIALRKNAGQIYIRAYEALRQARIYVWEPPAMDAFWKFWDDPRNKRRFKDEFWPDNRLVYRQDLACREVHMFPAPGRLFGEDLANRLFKDDAASIIFPPTTRAIGISSCTGNGLSFLAAIIESVMIDPTRLNVTDGGMLRLDRLPAIPKIGTLEANRMIVWTETRCPQILDGYLSDLGPLTWLSYIYQLQIFLLQPFVGFTRKVRHGKTTGKRPPQPAPEIVEVLMRDPLPSRIPRYIFLAVHPVTGRKLEFEVDVRGHTRRCKSGKLAWVREHKRGPQGKVREKVIKVIR